MPPQKGGVYHPTDLKLIKVSNEAGRTYTAGANAAWVSPFWTPCSIPVIRSAVKLLMNSKWREPKILEMEVMVNSMSDPNNQQHRLGSMLKRLSPEEDHISYVLATWRDISIGENVEERGGMPIDLRSLSDQSVSASIHHISDSYLSLSQLKFQLNDVLPRRNGGDAGCQLGSRGRTCRRTLKALSGKQQRPGSPLVKRMRTCTTHPFFS